MRTITSLICVFLIHSNAISLNQWPNHFHLSFNDVINPFKKSRVKASWWHFGISYNKYQGTGNIVWHSFVGHCLWGVLHYVVANKVYLHSMLSSTEANEVVTLSDHPPPNVMKLNKLTPYQKRKKKGEEKHLHKFTWCLSSLVITPKRTKHNIKLLSSLFFTTPCRVMVNVGSFLLMNFARVRLLVGSRSTPRTRNGCQTFPTY